MLPKSCAWWVLALLLTACTSSPLDPGIRRLETTQEQRQPTPIQLALPFLANVGLTAQQTQQIEAVIKQAWPQPDAGTAQQDAQAFQAAVSGAQVDQDQLRQLLTKSETEERANSLKLVDVLADVRPLLTDAQRAQAARAILNPPKQQQQPQQQQEQQQGPQLTPEQQQLFEATQVAPTDPQAVPRAIAGLLQTGETDALTQALMPTRDVATQVEAQVTALSSLTPEQRQAMFPSAGQGEPEGAAGP
jgi:hypothetical protein